MAIYSTFFVCQPEELPAAFPGWKLPLATPVRREFRNPFTGEMIVQESTAPDWPDDGQDADAWESEVVAIEGSYADYLESRLPLRVRSFAHFVTKGVTQVELEPLLEATDVAGSPSPALFAPPSVGAVLLQLPAEVAAKLGTLDANELAVAWAAALSTPEHTHSVSGEQLNDGCSASDALAILEPLIALARQISPSQQIYLLSEA